VCLLAHPGVCLQYLGYHYKTPPVQTPKTPTRNSTPRRGVCLYYHRYQPEIPVGRLPIPNPELLTQNPEENQPSLLSSGFGPFGPQPSTFCSAYVHCLGRASDQAVLRPPLEMLTCCLRSFVYPSVLGPHSRTPSFQGTLTGVLTCLLRAFSRETRRGALRAGGWPGKGVFLPHSLEPGRAPVTA